jgi:hypothetical protein
VSFDVWTIITFCSGAASAGLFTYINEKAKNRALVEDMKRIEHEKHQVAHEYAEKLETLRKTYALEIEQKKHQYQVRQHQYINFFSKLDDYTTKTNDKIKSDVVSEFSKLVLTMAKAEIENNDEKAATAVNEFMFFSQNFMSDLNSKYVALKQETYAVRLVTLPETEELICKLESSLENFTHTSFKYLNALCTPQGFDNPDTFDYLLNHMRDNLKELDENKKLLLNKMKRELNEI